MVKRAVRNAGKVSIRDYWNSKSDADALLGETGMADAAGSSGGVRKAITRRGKQEKIYDFHNSHLLSMEC